jgi:entericidin B
MRTTIATFSLIALALLTACNTIEGAGQDLKSGGQSIERAADDNK